MDHDRDALTDDTLFRGRLFCRQPRCGYRFSVDSVLAAHFANPDPTGQILDLGCGCGVIGLILAHRFPSLHVTCVEVQAELAAIARENIQRNRFGNRCRIVEGDVRLLSTLLAPESMDLVICNPPYRKMASGRINCDDQAARARHELFGTVADFVHGAAYAVKNRGRVVFVYPAARASSLLVALHGQRLTLKRLQPVYSYPGVSGARLILVEALKNGGEQADILAPFYIYERKNGAYSPAMHLLEEGRACWPE